jgi:chaperonin GroEL (HSP60 family)
VIAGCTAAKAVSILLRGGSQHLLDEVERTLEDALGVLKDVIMDGRVVPGAGAPEVEAALGLRKWGASIGGREQLAIEAFADALETIPRALAENAGLDAIELLAQLRSAHEAGQTSAGINVLTGKVEDAWERHIIEPLRVKTQAIQAAAEVASMILRIDDVVASKPQAEGRSPAPRGRAPGGGMRM